MRYLAALLLPVLLSSCSSLFYDERTDYARAKELPPLNLGTDTRPINPLWVIPPGPSLPEGATAKKFKAPAPKPLEVAVTNTVSTVVGTVGKEPILTQDGNGYPIVMLSGDFLAIWDNIQNALLAAKITIDDRDQRLGLYYLKLQDDKKVFAIYQLRLIKGQGAYTLTLQKDPDNLASQALSQRVCEAIVAKWPK
jgi:uncharacterized lipoprotein